MDDEVASDGGGSRAETAPFAARPPGSSLPDATDETTDLDRMAAHGDRSPAEADGWPPKIGRYRVIRLLGRGGFGRVYLARDDELDRPVAIKVPDPDRVAGLDDVAAYLAEARALARLDHPHIVPVHDAGRTGDGVCYVVSRYVEGTDLAGRMRHGRMPFADAAELVAAVAEALHHAHTRGLVHRDIKPANILLDAGGRPSVADFGLALRDEDFGKEAALAGTPAYMSPEQARGEGHLVDGRSDIFSLGVVFYELLTGRRPFRGDSLTDILRQVIAAEARPPRQVDDTTPRELERICLKALSKRASERYTTARDMAEDLRHFLRATATAGLSPSSAGTIATSPGPDPVGEAAPITAASARSGPGGSSVVKVVPRGLRSFDRNDADFFLELLPGPRDRDGLPESLRFWKARIESTDPDASFRAGLIYGPSGCGKSSMVKAGLLPRLGGNVLAVYVEATPEETEARLLRGLRKACPDLPADRGLVDTVAALRRGRAHRAGRKVLMVLDQFEQWLFARRDEDDAGLVAALRHCDGEHVQAIAMVRDDFWMAATRFLRDLDVRLIEGENSAAVDLFDPLHARKVLAAFGRAFGVLPERPADPTPEQAAFLDQAVAGLAQDGKVIPVRLALFAEMVKGKPWAASTLREVGGAEGVGVTFLEETFSAPSAPPEHRLHQKAARAVLRALLPRVGSDIKGQMRSASELREASGYEGRPHDFEDLVRILEPELRLIAPTDPEGSANEGASARTGPDRYYQLTHDYMVPALRDWLARKQRETRRGRAELRLAELAALWEARPENRHLPTAREWASIRALTRPKDWTDPERRMMRRAGRFHGRRALCLAALVALVIGGGVESEGRLRAAGLVDSLRAAATTDVPPLIGQLARYRRWADPRLRRMLEDSPESSRDRLHASLALLPVDPSQVDYLGSRLLGVAPAELPVLRAALAPHRSRLVPTLWAGLERAQPGDPGLLNSAAALALYDPDGPRWAELGGKVAEALVQVNPIFLGQWLEALRPVRRRLAPPLETIFVEGGSEAEHELATNILVNYAADDPDRLAALLMAADPKAYRALFPIAARHAEEVLPLFRARLASGRADRQEERDTEPARDDLARRRARAAVALVRLGHPGDVWPLLRHSPDPRLRSFIVNWLNPLGADPGAIVAELDRLHPPATRHAAPATPEILFHPETSARRALILALGTYGMDALPLGERGPLIARLLDLYEHDPDSGIHGASAWALRQWKQHQALEAIDARLRGRDRAGRRWFVNGRGQTFVLIEGPVEFLMGSPPDEPDRSNDLAPRIRRIGHSLAIAAEEVGARDYLEFVSSAAENRPFEVARKFLDRYTTAGGPITGVSWYGAAAYCNWLSEREGLPRDEWCYERNDRDEYAEGMKIKPDARKLAGYRLPTEAEWEYACRAGSLTSRYHGSALDLLGKYARYQANSREHAWPCGTLLPNDLGLFDMLGNVYEWCQERYDDQATKDGESEPIESIDEHARSLRGGSFYYQPALVRSASRSRNAPSNCVTSNGFRVARTYK